MDRFPELSSNCVQDLIIERETILELLESIYLVLVDNYPEINNLVNQLTENTDPESLRNLADTIFLILPMKSLTGQLHPLISTQEQLNMYLHNEKGNIGDCKFLTLITAYICITKCQLVTSISIRNYSGHPVLFVELKGRTYKVSYLHEKPQVKEYIGKEDPFTLLKTKTIDTAFPDAEFPNDNSILFWKISDAIFILDCMNILRRCVVNYALNPQTYQEIFNKVKIIIAGSGIHHTTVVSYWEQELERIKDMWLDPRFNKDPNKFREIVIKGLRF